MLVVWKLTDIYLRCFRGDGHNTGAGNGTPHCGKRRRLGVYGAFADRPSCSPSSRLDYTPHLEPHEEGILQRKKIHVHSVLPGIGQEHQINSLLHLLLSFTIFSANNLLSRTLCSSSSSFPSRISGYCIEFNQHRLILLQF